ncbi:MAG: NAD-dependent epimerase/dehydratase family protein, partial [Sulfuricurvum sp.]|nr:NAD-dependent epimerase/dehydratase family protein [Sulfuricurvum sp.]
MSLHFTVLGANGFIGRHLVEHLKNQGYECDTPAKYDDFIFSKHLGHVIYAIGLTADFRTRPLDTVEAHVCVLRRLMKEGSFDSLTYLSSTRLYSGSSSTSETAALVVNPYKLEDLYNISKLMGESLCLHAGKANTKVVRLSNIVGLRSDSDSFIDQLLEEGYTAGSIKLHTALDSKKDYLYIDDAVSLIGAIALSSKSGIFNVASGEGVENAQVIDFLETEM